MFAKLKRLDEGFISLLQEGYLWLFDRTGVYMATLQLIIIAWTTLVTIQSSSGRGWSIIMIVLGALNFLLLGHRYYMQASSIKLYNAHSLAFQELAIRHFFNLMLLTCLPGEIKEMDIVGMVQTFALLTYNYGFLVLLRERDRKPFFEFKRAMAGTA